MFLGTFCFITLYIQRSQGMMGIIYSLLINAVAILPLFYPFFLPLLPHFTSFQVTARYSRDPYKMLDQLKKMNLKHVKVAYGVKKNDTSSKKS